MNQKTTIIITCFLITSALIGGGVLWYQQTIPHSTPTSVENTNQPTNQPTASGTVTPPTKTDCTDELDTTCWNTYTNKEYGFSFKFPNNWDVNKTGVYKGPVDDLVISSPLTMNNERGETVPVAKIKLGYNLNKNGNIIPQDLEIAGMGIAGTLEKEELFVVGSFFGKEFVYGGLNPFDPEDVTPETSGFVHLINANIFISFAFGAGGDNRGQYLILFEHIIKTLKEI